MKLWKIFAVISTGLVLGLAYSYLSQEADLSASLRRHPSDGLPGTGHNVPQPNLPTNKNVGSQFASAQNAELTKNPPNEEVRMRVRFQKRAGPHKRPSDPLGSEEEEEDVGRPREDVSKQKAVTWTDLLKEESNQRRLPEQTVQRHKRGADWTEQATKREGSSGDDEEDEEENAARIEEMAVEVAEGAEMAAEVADSALEVEEDGNLDRGSGRRKGDKLEESAERGPARDKMALNSDRNGNLRQSDSAHLSAAGAEDDEDAREDTAVEDASAGAGDDGDDEEEDDVLRLSQANVRGRGQADGRGSMGQPKQAGTRVKGTLLQASNAAGKIKQQPKTQRAGAKAAGETGRSQSVAVGKGVDKAAKNKTAAFRPALLGFNLTWEMLEGEEELYRQDVATPVALGAGLQGQHDRPLVAQLTAALAKSRSRDGVVIVTWASAAYLDFLRNWVHHLTLLEVENFLIGAMDGEVAEYLRQENLPYFDMQAAMYSHMEGHLMKPTKEARMLAFNKIGVAQTLNTFGLNALLCDADVVWLRDPSDFFSGLEEADILVATDGLGVANAKDDDGLETPEAGLRSQMSTAIVFLRHGRGSRNFLDAWDSSLRRNTSRTEQEAFNAVARAGVKPLKTHPDNWRVFYGMGRTVTFGVLPASGFANGHSYFVQRLYEVMRVSPYAVHMSYVFGGVAAKRNRLREEQIWLDDPEYYDQKRLLTLDIHVPAIPDNFERLKNDYMVELHLKLMQHQLDQLVVGFAMAMTLNRTLVMPRLVCFCDRFWSPLERCRAPGAVRTQLPFVCPLDHILRPSHFGDDPSLYGPPIAFREHSFWDHPDTPAELKDNQVEVVVAGGESSSSAQKRGNQLVIPRDLSDADLWKTLEPYDDIKVLIVKNVTGIFRGFAEKSAADGFWRRMAHITGIWCCNYDGGVAYRMAPRLNVNSAISASL